MERSLFVISFWKRGMAGRGRAKGRQFHQSAWKKKKKTNKRIFFFVFFFVWCHGMSSSCLCNQIKLVFVFYPKERGRERKKSGEFSREKSEIERMNCNMYFSFDSSEIMLQHKVDVTLTLRVNHSKSCVCSVLQFIYLFFNRTQNLHLRSQSISLNIVGHGRLILRNQRRERNSRTTNSVRGLMILSLRYKKELGIRQSVTNYSTRG